ncbi:uncharacterized protein LOC111713539 isoform X2 [Eurytemora carolleeae]|uniref:uncharacterized protein LOC111713539 isoform X1 n=1 Tax=Eurytemora carolleeae TaxID=1294199 RepID=UPI000C77D1A1|nr:uncharacterized protein LOC111713539 isoform X1 [Eurytemora carolleeae]XP_023344184.1 uncharacterized protein LOC111713539 isoform X2 [Eurytemora carolleeae]|eukprot:XP_023344183.1 uncharacterized protein LOC111713539 isoform X1 [Eurytemora affinis]
MAAVISVIIIHSLILLSSAQDCSEFVEATCGLDEYNIIKVVVNTTPSDCQTLCRTSHPPCNYFTHYIEECWLLRNCTDKEVCQGCISGPESPPIFSQCPWPPAPTTTTTKTTTTTTTTDACNLSYDMSCELTDDNVVGFKHDISINICQDSCQKEPACNFYTWFKDTKDNLSAQEGCWLVKQCDESIECPGCISGPQYPDLDSCNL